MSSSATPPHKTSDSASDSPLLVSVLTPPARGAVATVALVGRQAAEIADRLFHAAGRRNLATSPPGQVLFGRWGSEQGEEVVACRTALQCVEIHCHGGLAASAALVQSLVELGATAVTWDQLLRQSPAAAAIVPGISANAADDATTSLIRVEALEALAVCTTRRTAKILLAQERGALETPVRKVLDHLRTCDVAAAQSTIQELLAYAPLGLHLTQPWQVVLAGQPNVGKSSLLNRLLGYARAIVTDRPGTTRDTVAEGTALDGWPVTLVDTAGLRDADDPLEAAGVALTRQEAEQADLVVLVFDASQSWQAADQQLVDTFPEALVVHNKCDLPRSAANDSRPAGLEVSAITGHGIEPLATAIAAALVPTAPPDNAAIPFTTRQVTHLNAALQHLPHNPPAAQEELVRLLCMKRADITPTRK